MKNLKSMGYYSLQGGEQYDLYDIARGAQTDAKMWRGLAVIGIAAFLAMCFFYDYERQTAKAEVAKADARVLLMVEHLGKAPKASSPPTTPNSQ